MRFVYEVAAELEMSPRGFLEWCKKYKIHYTSTTSLVDEETYQLVKKLIQPQKGLAVIDALCEEGEDSEWEVVDDFPGMSQSYVEEMTDRIIQQEIDVKRGK